MLNMRKWGIWVAVELAILISFFGIILLAQSIQATEKGDIQTGVCDDNGKRKNKMEVRVIQEIHSRGPTWWQDIAIANSANNEKAPFIASSPDGAHICVVYEKWSGTSSCNNIGVALSSNHGEDWTILELSAGTTPLCVPAVTLTNDHAFIVYREDRAPPYNSCIWMFRVELEDVYSSLFKEIDVDTDNDHRPYICSDAVKYPSSPYLGVVYYDATNKWIMFNKSEDLGNTWFYPDGLLVADIQYEPNTTPFQSIAYSNDTLHVAFVANKDFAQTTDPSVWYSSASWVSAWSSPVERTPTHDPGDRYEYPIVDAKGNFVVIAYDNYRAATDRHYIRYSYSTNGGSFWGDEKWARYVTSYKDRYPHVSIEPGSGEYYYIGSANYQNQNYYLGRQYIDDPGVWDSLGSFNDDANVSDEDRVALVSTYGPSKSLGVAAAWACLVGSDYDIYFDASWCPCTTDVSETPTEAEPPQNFELFQNYPNPFNPTTNIEFLLPRSGQVKIEIFNILGQKVRTLVDQRLRAGQKVVDWDGRDDSGKEVTSGIYFYRLRTSEFSQTNKMVVLR